MSVCICWGSIRPLPCSVLSNISLDVEVVSTIPASSWSYVVLCSRSRLILPSGFLPIVVVWFFLALWWSPSQCSMHLKVDLSSGVRMALSVWRKGPGDRYSRRQARHVILEAIYSFALIVLPNLLYRPDVLLVLIYKWYDNAVCLFLYVLKWTSKDFANHGRFDSFLGSDRLYSVVIVHGCFGVSGGVIRVVVLLFDPPRVDGVVDTFSLECVSFVDVPSFISSM